MERYPVHPRQLRALYWVPRITGAYTLETLPAGALLLPPNHLLSPLCQSRKPQYYTRLLTWLTLQVLPSPSSGALLDGQVRTGLRSIPTPPGAQGPDYITRMSLLTLEQSPDSPTTALPTTGASGQETPLAGALPPLHGASSTAFFFLQHLPCYPQKMAP